MEQIKEIIKRENPVLATSTPATAKTTLNHSEFLIATKSQDITISFGMYLDFLEDKGKSLYGNQFRINKDDHELIYKLVVYTIRDKANADRLGISLAKGIMLAGPIGCGKTSLMNLLRHITPQPYRHVMKSCRDISFDFIQDGYEVIKKFSRHSFVHQHGEMAPRTYCFDDLGTEQNLKYYGNKCNVMAEILLSRYEYLYSYNMTTHITTNLSASEIESFYGDRVRSRLREMLNVIAFDKAAKDKRI